MLVSSGEHTWVPLRAAGDSGPMTLQVSRPTSRRHWNVNGPVQPWRLSTPSENTQRLSRRASRMTRQSALRGCDCGAYSAPEQHR